MVKILMRFSYFFFLLFFATHAYSQNLLASDDNQVRVLSSDAKGVVMEVVTPSSGENDLPFFVEPVELEGQTFQRLTLKGLTHIIEEGKPQLPIKGILLQIPEDAQVNLQVESKGTVTYSGYRVPPACRVESLSPTGESSPTSMSHPMNNRLYFDTTIYSKDTFYPQQPAEIRILGLLRDVRVASIGVYPIQYNPVQNEVKFHRRLQLTISFQNSKKSGNWEKRKNSNLGKTEITKSPSYQIAQLPDYPITKLPNYDFQQLYRNLIINFNPNSPPIKSTTSEMAVPPKQNSIPSPAYKIIVDQDGIYRVTYSDLKQAGIDITDINPKTLKLMNKGKAVPLFVSGENDGRFDTWDYLEFQGFFNRGTYSLFGEYTIENVYWLSWGKERGARMVREIASPEDASSTATTPASYRDVIHLEQDNLRGGLGYADEKRDFWFWTQIQSLQKYQYPFELHDIRDKTKCTIRIMFHGHTLSEHHISTSINETSLSEISWSGQKEYLAEVEVDSASLKEGENILTIFSPGDTPAGENDSVFFNWFEIEYWRAFTAHNDMLKFAIPDVGTYRFTLTGFSTPIVEVYKSGFSKLANVKIERENIDKLSWQFETGAASYKLTFIDDVIQPTTYLALATQQKKKPKAIIKDNPSELHSSVNGADYIIIAYDNFYEDVLPLAKHRSQRFRTAVVKIQDIYDEFSWGVFSPEAIRDFIRYAYYYWRPPAPTYVFLVGDATWDFKRGKNFVPACYFHSLKWGQAATDHWYACVNGTDPLPDLFIGRITTRTKAETKAAVEKIIRYETQPVFGDWRRHLLMLAAPGSFTRDSEQLIQDYSLLRRGYKVTRIYTDTDSPYYGDTSQLLDFWNGGGSFIHFTGHGGGNIWADSKLFTLGDVQFLSNKDYPAFVTSFTCFTSYFDDPGKSGLNEALVNFPEGGAIASFGSTGLGWVRGDYYLEQMLFNALFNHGIRRTGPAIAETKISMLAAYHLVDMVSLFNLLGDAATLVPLPQRKIDVMARLVGDDRWIQVRGVIDEAFNGQALVEIYKELTPNEAQIYLPDYQVKLQVNNGRFNGRIKLSELPFLNGRSDANSQDVHKPIIRCYAWDEMKGVDAVGAALLHIAGEDEIDLSIFSDDIQFTVIPQLEEYALKVRLKAIIYNLGQKAAFAVGVRFYKGPPYAGGAIIGSVVIPLIEGGQNATAEIDYTPNIEAEDIYVQIDPENQILESNKTNNTAEKRLKFNSYTITPEKGSDDSIFSLDGNLTVNIPKNVVKKAIQLGIESVTVPLTNQPDLQYAPLPQKTDGGMYRLSISDEGAINSEIFSISLTFRFTEAPFSQTDNLAIYHWQNDEQLWEIASDEIQRESGIVKAKVNQLGAFSLIHSTDFLPPLIQITLTDEQFTHSGVFTSETPILSAIIEDANGVGKVQAFINGKPVETVDLTISRSPSPMNAMMVAYTPTLDAGDYLFAVEASDTSGNIAQKELSFRVGGELKILNIANHPNPFSKETYFTYVITQPVENVAIKIYSSSGRLIAQLKDAPSRTGYNEILWDGKDKSGADVANGVYFYKIIVETEDGKLSQIGKLAVIR